MALYCTDTLPLSHRTGEPDFATAMLAWRSSLSAYATALTRDRNGAEDLLQDLFVLALEKQSRFRAGSDLRAWLFTLMHNLHVSRVRRARREAGSLSSIDLAEIDAPLAPQQEAVLLLTEVGRLVDRLPPAQSDVRRLAGEGLTYREIAAVLALPLGTVRSRLSRGRAFLSGGREGDICIRAGWRTAA